MLDLKVLDTTSEVSLGEAVVEVLSLQQGQALQTALVLSVVFREDAVGTSLTRKVTDALTAA